MMQFNERGVTQVVDCRTVTVRPSDGYETKTYIKRFTSDSGLSYILDPIVAVIDIDDDEAIYCSSVQAALEMFIDISRGRVPLKQPAHEEVV
tara:strand:- start:387 stop:662 length:276 start_codon:yes stop_codon:yes gene_type:complete